MASIRHSMTFHPWMFLFILVTLISVVCGELVQDTTYISSRRSRISSVQVNDKIYFAGGYEQNDKIASKKIEVFDTNTRGLVKTLELPVARGFISSSHISPRLFFAGGTIYDNCPFFWNSATHNFSMTPTCGSTVKTPTQLSTHNSKLTVLGSFSADFYDIATGAWTSSPKLTNHMQQLAAGNTIVYEDLIISVGGFNITSNEQYRGAWIFNTTSNDLQLFNNVTTGNASVQSRDFRFNSNTIVLWISDRCFVHRLNTANWIEILASNILDAASFDNTTLVVDSAGYWQIDWQNNAATERIQVDGLLAAFGIQDQLVILKAGETFVYDGTWTSTSNTINTISGTLPWVSRQLIWAQVDSQQLYYTYSVTTKNVDFIVNFEYGQLQTVLVLDDQETIVMITTGSSSVMITTLPLGSTSTSSSVWNQPTPKIGTNLIQIGGDVIDIQQNTVWIDVASNERTVAAVTVPQGETVRSADGLVMMSQQPSAQEYKFIDVYNYENGSWEVSIASNVLQLQIVSAYRPVAVIEDAIIVADYGILRSYNTTAKEWTSSLPLSSLQVSFAYSDPDIPVRDRTAYFLGSVLGSVIQWTLGSPATFVRGQTSTSGTVHSLAAFDDTIYMAALVNAKISIIYTFNMTQRSWDSFFLPVAVSPTGFFMAAASNILFVFSGDTGTAQYISVDDLSSWNSTTFSSDISPSVTTTLGNGIILTAGGEHTLGYYSNQITWHNISSFVISVESPTASPNGGVLTGNDLVTAIVVPIVVGVAVAVGLVVFFVLRRNKKKKQELNVVGLEAQYGQWFIPYTSITFGDQLGQGASGQVFKGTWNGTSVALKVSPTQANTTVIKELELMMQLRSHPNVVQLFGFSVHPETESVILVIEYCSGGSLDTKLYESDWQIPSEQKSAWIYGAAKGLEHLHANNIVHRDIAARNVLLQNNEPKITDFGMSRVVDEQLRGTTASELGPIRWMAPEALKNKEYSAKSDVWSFGILMFEIISQNEPHLSMDPIEVGRSIRDRGLTPTIPDTCSPHLAAIAKACWNMIPSDRPTMAQIVEKLEQAK